MRKPYQRCLRLIVKQSGQIRLVCHRGATQSEIREFLHANAAWLKKCVDKFTRLRANYPTKKFIDGEKFPFLGRELEWRYVEDGEERIEIRSPYILASKDLFFVGNLQVHLKKLYQEKADFYLPGRLQYWAQNMNLSFRKLKIRFGKSSWGSCSRDGKITLNTKLMCYSRDIIDYVLIHELAHLVYPNHSKNFWNLVREFCSEYKARRKQLRTEHCASDFI